MNISTVTKLLGKMMILSQLKIRIGIGNRSTKKYLAIEKNLIIHFMPN